MFSIARKLQSVLLLLCVGAIFAAPTSARTKMNFNAGWRFTLGDPAGAAAPGYDDAAWQAIGLPHSFSIPYFQARSFYVGYGWYRKHLALKHVPDQRYNLEFEGAFQDAEVFVNGIAVGRHRGGYTGFSFDITKVLHAGDNLIAVRLNNKWDATLAPRAGEHVFSGGLYRDVWLVETKPVHVPWTGTRITTPNLTEKSGQVQAETEVRNDGDAPAQVVVQTAIVDDRGETVARMSDEQLTVAPRTTAIAKQVSAAIASPHLWSPETPTLYRVVTSLVVARHKTDTYETEFGFRWLDSRQRLFPQRPPSLFQGCERAPGSGRVGRCRHQRCYRP
jgi:beta-galactosidase/beta-glucuronidase